MKILIAIAGIAATVIICGLYRSTLVTPRLVSASMLAFVVQEKLEFPLTDAEVRRVGPFPNYYIDYAILTSQHVAILRNDSKNVTLVVLPQDKNKKRICFGYPEKDIVSTCR